MCKYRKEIYLMNKIRTGALLLAVSMFLQASLPAMAAAQIQEETAEQFAQTGVEQTESSSQITAQVPSATPSYYLTMPESIALGDLDATKDYKKEYNIGVQVDHPGNLKLKITSDREITYKNVDDSAKQMTGYNSFGTQYFTEDGKAPGTLTVYKEDIARVPKGTYTGTLHFYAAFVKEDGQTENGSSGKTDISGTVTDDKNQNNGTATEKTVRAHVLMEQNGQIKDNREESMCWPFFHKNAELKLRTDGQVDVTMYMIDPIPGANFKQYGTPLEHVYVSGGTADISVENFGAVPGNASSKVTLQPGDDSYASEAVIDNGKQVTKSFVKDRSGGVFVPEDGDYTSVPIRFTVPLSAIRNSNSGTILLTAYVKPMTVWKQFFITLDDVSDFGKNTGGNSTDGTGSQGTYQVEKSEVPAAGVNGLKDYAEKQKDGAYTMHIRNADSQRDQEGISQIASLIAAGQTSGVASYYDISLECQTDTENVSINDTGNSVIEIRLPLDASKGTKLSVYRSHDGKAGLMQPLAARKTTTYVDNTYYADLTGGYLYVYTSKFSVYGIYQSKTDGQSGSSDSGDSDSGNDSDTGSDSGTTSGSDSRKDGEYTAKVSVRKSDNIKSSSMCAPLFYARADLKVSGSNTKVTMYVIDPIPKYASEGTPLSKVKVTANGKTYSASVDSGNKVSRYFEASEQFISSAGNYYATPITFTIPTSAIEKSADGKVKMSAYVNAVMKSTQEFYVVFSDWKSGETESSGTAEEIDESTTTTEDAAVSAASNTDISTAETSSGALKNGEYLVPVTAYKEKTNETSMMADYMYPKATMKVSGNTTTLTIYIQHTVAGMEDGGPKWISYNGTKATKVSNAMEISGISYDGFTFTLSGEVPSPMLVTMYINAMKMEVKARLAFDFAKKTAVSGTSLENALEETAVEQTENAADAENAVTENSAEGQIPGSENSVEADRGTAGYELVTDAGMLGVVFLVLTALISSLTAVWWYKKRRG